jgi:hypothetical protein
MKFFSDIRLLLLAIWLGAAVFFIGVAQTAFAVVAERDVAGAIVGRTLMILNIAGIAISVVLLLTSLLGASKVSLFWLWIERFLLLVLATACAVNQFVISFWLASIRSQIGRPIDEVAADDPLRMQFDQIHQYSVWILMAAMAAALIAFFIIANRSFNKPKGPSSDVYDFSKEFKV